MAERQQSFSLIPKIINGGVAGVVGVTAVFPLDLVKTRLQNQQIGPAGEKMYSSIADAFRKTYRSEGFFGMYKGWSVNVLFITPEKAIKLAANDLFRFYLRKADKTLPIYRQMIAGGLAGFCQIVITTPMELLKIQMQDAGRTKTGDKKLSATRLAFDVLKRHGLLGLYRGYGATLLRDVTFSMIYFPLFANFDNLGPRKPDGSGEAKFWVSFLAGLAAGTISAFAVTPLDVVKTRLQTEKKAAGEVSYTGIPNAFYTIMKNEGPLAFFKGGLCRVMVIAPLFGIAQMVYYVGVGEYFLGIDKGSQ